MPMNHRQRAVIALCTTLAIAILPALLMVIYVDPFQIYHRPYIRDMGLQENQRYQNAGLINSYLADANQGYDSVLIGTSMSQNFTGAMVSNTLHWQKPLRLFMPGAVAEEQLTVLQHALHSGRVKHVLLELHPFLYQDSYRQRKQVLADASLYFPDFLYNNSVLDDAPYIFNIDVLKISWRALLPKSTANNLALENLTPDNIGYWGDDANVNADYLAFNSPDHIARLQQQTAGFTVTAKSKADIRALDYPILADSLLPLLESYCNQELEIVMYVPPWPRFRYQKSEKVTLRALYSMRRILETTAHCRNITLYNFDLLDFAGDLNNYKDEQHYLPAINQDILNRIAGKENRLTLDELDSFEQNFVSTLNNYSVFSSKK